MLTFTWSRFPI